MKSFNKLILATILLSTLFLPSFHNLRAFPVVTVGDIPRTIKDHVLDLIINNVAKRAISSITQSITNWANTGFQGKPAFVQDLKKVTDDIEGETVSSLLNEIETEIGGNLDLDGFFCGPFDQELRRALRIQLAIKTSKVGYKQYSKCTISSILKKTGNTLEDFSNDFTKGGWPAWLELTQPQNNRFGAWGTLQTEIWNREGEAKENKAREIEFGKGFLSTFKPRECKPNPAPINFGQAIGPNGWAINAKTKVEECPPEFQKTPDQWVTPGTIIANQVNKSLGLGLDKIVAADELDEMIGAILSGLTRKALTGVGGLLGLSQGTNSELSKLEGERDRESKKLSQTLTSRRASITNAINGIGTISDLEGALQMCQDRVEEIRNSATNRVIFKIFGGGRVCTKVISGDRLTEEETCQQTSSAEGAVDVLVANQQAQCDLIRKKLSAALLKEINDAVSSIDEGGGGGPGENPFKCRDNFGGASANRAVDMFVSGPLPGGTDVPITGMDSFKFYNDVYIDFDLNIPEAGAGPIFFLQGPGRGSSHYLGYYGELIDDRDLRHSLFDATMFLGDNEFYRGMSTDWTRSGTYHIASHFNSAKNEFTMKVTHGSDVMGNIFIGNALRVPDVADPGMGLWVDLGENESWTYSNLKISMSPGGPYNGGLARICNAGETPYGTPTPGTTPTAGTDTTTPPNTANIDIRADNSNGPITIEYGTNSKLTWTSSNATSCVASGAWTGSKTSASGNTSYLTPTLFTNASYTLTCKNPTGQSISDTVNITVSPAQTPIAFVNPSKKVKTLYLVPQDKLISSANTQAIGRASVSLQYWYKQELKDKAFALDGKEPVVVGTTHNSSYYSSNNSGGEEKFWFWNNVLADAKAVAGANLNDADSVWLIYIDADEACGQMGERGLQGVSLGSANSLRGLTNVPTTAICQSEIATSKTINAWVGSLGHQLGHAFGLAHSNACELNQSACQNNAIVQNGADLYPRTFLTASDRILLKQNLFFYQI